MSAKISIHTERDGLCAEHIEHSNTHWIKLDCGDTTITIFAEPIQCDAVAKAINEAFNDSVAASHLLIDGVEA